MTNAQPSDVTENNKSKIVFNKMLSNLVTNKIVYNVFV